MDVQLYTSGERGVKKLDWLTSNFTFSFSGYYHPVKRGFGLLRVFNDDVVQPGKGFGLHAHYNMEIISIMLAGRMNHIDSMGYSEEVAKDAVQIMSAGDGLKHKEYNIGDEPVNFLQIWIEPKQQNINPRYQKRSFPEAQRENELVTVVSFEEGQQHCWINQNARILMGYYTRPATEVYSFNAVNMCLFVFVIDGSIAIAGHDLGPRDAIGIWNTAEVAIRVTGESRFVLIEVPVNH